MKQLGSLDHVAKAIIWGIIVGVAKEHLCEGVWEERKKDSRIEHTQCDEARSTRNGNAKGLCCEDCD